MLLLHAPTPGEYTNKLGEHAAIVPNRLTLRMSDTNTVPNTLAAIVRLLSPILHANNGELVEYQSAECGPVSEHYRACNQRNAVLIPRVPRPHGTWRALGLCHVVHSND